MKKNKLRNIASYGVNVFVISIFLFLPASFSFSVNVFGDGASSTIQNPSHTYADEGNYSVSLTVSGPNGSDTETKTDYIEVSYPSKAMPSKAMPWIPLLLDD